MSDPYFKLPPTLTDKAALIEDNGDRGAGDHQEAGSDVVLPPSLTSHRLTSSLGDQTLNNAPPPAPAPSPTPFAEEQTILTSPSDQPSDSGVNRGAKQGRVKFQAPADLPPRLATSTPRKGQKDDDGVPMHAGPLLAGVFETSQDNGQAGISWMVSFGDLSALLLTFFVMVFAVSDVPSETWDQFVNTVHSSFRVDQHSQFQDDLDLSVKMRDQGAGEGLDYLKIVLQRKMIQNPALAGAQLVVGDHGLHIYLPRHFHFTANAVKPLESNDDFIALQALANALSGVPNQIEILGYGGAVAPAEINANPETGIYEIPAEKMVIGTARAYAIARLFQKAGYKGQLRYSGRVFQSGRPPAANANLPYDYERLKTALSSRIEFVILTDYRKLGVLSQ